jgi:hypothetical protein
MSPPWDASRIFFPPAVPDIPFNDNELRDYTGEFPQGRFNNTVRGFSERKRNILCPPTFAQAIHKICGRSPIDRWKPALK